MSARRSLVLGALALPLWLGAVAQEPAARPTRYPLAEGKRAVRMMDDIYKIGVLTTHSMYVREPGTAAAVTWAKQVIRQVRARGWPDAHVFDATGRPLNPENSPQDTFERDALEAFRKGKASFERVEGDRLRYASSIPTVDESCVTCHVRSKVGDLAGGVSYSVLLDGPDRGARRRNGR